MVTDRQVKRLWQVLSSGKTLAQSADKANMDEKTARKYRRLGRLPSEVAPERTWRTREDPFAEVWPEVHEQLQEAPGLEAKTLFAWLQTKYPGKFDDSQLRSFQRGVKRWRATAGPAKEVFFSQVHHPGRLCASDFTHMKSLAVTIGGQPFDHLVYHFVLTYSNWESITICFSESFESLSEGLQNAVWELGGVPQRHRTDRMSLAVNNASGREGVHRAVHGAAGLLRAWRWRRSSPRSRTRTATSSNRTGGSRRRWSRPCCCVAAGTSRAVKPMSDSCRSWWPLAMRAAGSGWTEELPRLRRLPERRRESYKRVSVRVDTGKPDPRRPQHLFGSQPVDRREGRGAAVRGTRRGLVRPEGGGAFSTPAWAEEASRSTTGTSSTGWCGSRGLLRTIVTGRSCFRRAAFAWPTTPCGKRSRSVATRSIWGFSTWRHARARRRWTRRCERFWPATGP